MGRESFVIHRLGPQDGAQLEKALDLFAEAFDDIENYSADRPSSTYRDTLLARDDFILLVALAGQAIVGALAAYELKKFEQERSEFYIYDLAVGEDWRRNGIATALINTLKDSATKRQIDTLYVQADYGDDAAIALYKKLGTGQKVMHFDITMD
jgi:aminoglycoside 3-N-acetyltransferase I